MDAGPGINFFALNKERLLIATVGPLAVPETVHEEIRAKARREQRFAAAERVLAKLPTKYLEVLSDDATAELSAVVSRLSGMPMERRVRSSKDLGEMMVVAHAVVAAESGGSSTVLIDDGGGRRLAAAEAKRLDRLRGDGSHVGQIRLISTMTVLKNAAGKRELPDRQSMRDLYERLRLLDDGLIPLDQTDLMKLPCWSAPREAQ
ncbi:hypothetical protein ACFWQK_04745 [Brachybacterium paraconglomeratum]